jgi:membrane-associated tyrosine/threonine-specific cdc2-inhibitory kinase
MYLLHFLQVYKVRCKEDGKLYAVKRSHERFRGESDRYSILK